MLEGKQIVLLNYNNPIVYVYLPRGSSNTLLQGRKEVDKTSCEPCPAGYSQEEEGKDFCDLCPEGAVSTNTGASYCIYCPKVV